MKSEDPENDRGIKNVFAGNQKEKPQPLSRLGLQLKPGNQGLSELGPFVPGKAKLFALPVSSLTLRSLPRNIKEKPQPLSRLGLQLKPGSDLLAHGETPHYHRRCTVSLLSSGWDQVVPML